MPGLPWRELIASRDPAPRLRRLERLRLEVHTTGSGRDEALVRIFAVAVDHLDLLAGPRAIGPIAAHTGMEGAGEVEAVGVDVTTAAPGDRVVVATD